MHKGAPLIRYLWTTDRALVPHAHCYCIGKASTIRADVWIPRTSNLM